jgi:O-antigen/teichoic acid export membrane protein
LIIQVFRWLKTNSIILINAGSLVGATAVTGIMGFVYWLVAARQFPEQSVGLASADVSAMLLLGTLSVLGLGTLLIGELPRHRGREFALMSTALLIAGLCGAITGAAFALIAPLVSADFQHLRASVGTVALYSLGVGITTITIALDDALVGLLRGDLQFWRNSIFAVTKLALLYAAGLWLFHRSNVAIYTAWVSGIIISVIPLLLFFIRRRGWRGQQLRLDWDHLRKLAVPAAQHHALNLILQAPTMAMPVLVTILLSAMANAAFYVSWMISGFVFTGTMALTRVLFAINPDNKAELARKIRLTLGLSLLVCLLGNLILQVVGGPILTIFGSSYAEQATSSLRIIIIASLPSIIKEHYTAICRMQSKMVRAMIPAALGSLLELGFAALGARLAGLDGLCLGWVVALSLEALYMSFPVYQAARLPKSAIIETIPGVAIENIPTTKLPDTPAIFPVTTAKLPIIQVIQEALKDDTQKLAAIKQISRANKDEDATQKLPDIPQSIDQYEEDETTRKLPPIKHSTTGNIERKRLAIRPGNSI